MIIGILAGIALPQYKAAVAKARFSELKTTTRTYQQAVQRYYLINNTYTTNKNALDILVNTNNCTISVSYVLCSLKDKNNNLLLQYVIVPQTQQRIIIIGIITHTLQDCWED